MKLNAHQIQRLRIASKRPIPQLSKRALWMSVTVISILAMLWVIGGLYLNHQVRQDTLRIEQSRIEAQRRQEFMRRGVQYKQDLKQRTQTPRVRNVFDGR